MADELKRIVALPHRAVRALVRILREPAAAGVRAGDTNARLAELAHRIDELRGETSASAVDLTNRIDALNAVIGTLGHNIAHHQSAATDAWRQLGSTASALVAHAARSEGETPMPDAGLISIILPARGRLVELRRAVASVLAQTYLQWELIVIDDAGPDEAPVALGELESDARIRVVQGLSLGAAAARNTGIGEANGTIVTFLDSDNWWYPMRLETLARRLLPEAAWAVDEQLVLAAWPRMAHVRDSSRPSNDLDRGNFIDIGAVAARRSALDQLRPPARQGTPSGPFDPALQRLADWDLVQRLAQSSEPQRIGLVGQVYDERASGRISEHVPYGPAYHRIRSRIIGRPAEGLRILFAEWHFPQVTETYIQADIIGLRALGAEVEVWSDEGVATAYEPEVPWRRGSLEDHIRDVHPDLVLSHWLHVGHDHRPLTKRLGIPHAVRCHSFDFNPGIVEDLAKDPGVVVHLFGHLASQFADRPNVVVSPVGFDSRRFTPAEAKDRRLVLRLAAGLHTKDLATFMLAARRCPEHRFVLGIGRAFQAEERADELVQLAHDLDSPVEILIDSTHDEAARLTMDAGIYLHTHGESHVLGMPISTVEAMATGALVLARELPGIDYLDGGALRYSGGSPEARADHVAALINDTLHWTEHRWAEHARAAIDLAWTHHPANLVANDLLTSWRDHLGLAAPNAPAG